MKIGFFDSGLGGLTIMRAVMEYLPEYDYLYYGDTANVPYGDREEEEIYELTKAGVEYLFENGSALVVIACNTASAETLHTLQRTFLREAYPDRKILGVIVPTVEEIVERGCRRVVLIGTRRTIESQKYDIELDKLGRGSIEFAPVATPGLVPFIERGDIESAVEGLTELIEEVIEKGGDTLVLGCTHYTMMKDMLRERWGRQVAIFSQDEIVPYRLQKYLDGHPEIRERLTKDGTHEVHLTDPSVPYKTFLDIVVGRNSQNPQ